MSINKYHLNIKNYPQFSLGVDTINCDSITVQNKTLPFPDVNVAQKNRLTILSSSYPVSNLSDLNFSQSEIGMTTSTIYFELLGIDLINQTFDIQLGNFLTHGGRDPSTCVVTGNISDKNKNVNYLWFPKFITRTAGYVTINFITNNTQPGTITDLIGNIIIRY